ncbi:hypothetical protein OC834_005558 [Tilletia horrida]|uniref:Lipocalin/cytosolic fatty-acid binding domain-containing protein n=1 Tax=Tilletia horrida TaxID=155126 RepID=A0AAN6G8W8_9BASI|nr:hypothetical protein OC842_005938 [Tilletia horrida]KAK0524386.1 hypothetical protein OC834_005558 [Tilletia horrida]KAK0528892.1 hypothetical protein OC835_004507 [Tilletia horrida]KAK0558163.1 hypothetical protein OC844_005365 [Tilletia horrida]
MLFSTLASAFLTAFTLAAASPSPLIFGGSGSSDLPKYPPGISNATFDGKTKCTFPAPQSGFVPTKYVGTLDQPSVWYQLAASFQFFEIGCTCVYAKYGLYSNGSIAVNNFCLRNGSPSGVKGVAAPTPQFGAGTFNVNFGQPAGSCGSQAPNYIVNKYYTDSAGKYTAAIVGSSNFDGWFLLSKQRIVSRAQIDSYLKDIASLGYDLSKSYSITTQNDSCPAP